MFKFSPSAKLARTACAAMLLVAYTGKEARCQQDAERGAKALANWLECDYCTQNELAIVKSYGEAIVPGIVAVLNERPSTAKHADLGKALAERYDQLVEQSKKNQNAPVAVTKEKFVELYWVAFDVRHRVRAAQALAAIGEGRARAALEATASKADREDVRAAAREALRTLAR